MDAPTIGIARNVTAAVIRRGVQRVFISRTRRARSNVRRIVIASPWISTFQGKPYSLSAFVLFLEQRKVPTYVFTRPPESAEQHAAVEILKARPNVELVYNPSLHAKVYACIAPPPHGFAILGSANLTVNSEVLYEIGLLVSSAGGGEAIVRELASFGLDYLRTRGESRIVKRIDARRMRE